MKMCNMRPVLLLGMFLAICKKTFSSSCSGRLNGWMTFMNMVIFRWRNWDTTWLIVFPHPWNIQFEMIVPEYLLLPALHCRKELPMDEMIKMGRFLSGRPVKEPCFCVWYRWPTGSAYHWLVLVVRTRASLPCSHPPSSDSFLHFLF